MKGMERRSLSAWLKVTVGAASVICQEELSAEKSREQWEVPVEMWLGGFVDGVYGHDNGVETKEK
jgi:hypothetical protein